MVMDDQLDLHWRFEICVVDAIEPLISMQYTVVPVHAAMLSPSALSDDVAFPSAAARR